MHVIPICYYNVNICCFFSRRHIRSPGEDSPLRLGIGVIKSYIEVKFKKQKRRRDAVERWETALFIQISPQSLDDSTRMGNGMYFLGTESMRTRFPRIIIPATQLTLYMAIVPPSDATKISKTSFVPVADAFSAECAI